MDGHHHVLRASEGVEGEAKGPLLRSANSAGLLWPPLRLGPTVERDAQRPWIPIGGNLAWNSSSL